MSTGIQCVSCKHWHGLDTCDAYPEEIPDKIFSGEHNHDDPFPGDHGIRYDPVDDNE